MTALRARMLRRRVERWAAAQARVSDLVPHDGDYDWREFGSVDDLYTKEEDTHVQLSERDRAAIGRDPL